MIPTQAQPKAVARPETTPPSQLEWPSGPSERGSISLWVVLVVSVAFTALLGLVLDGGRVIDARLAAARAAGQAARAGADQLSQASIRSGGNAVASQQAAGTARSYLRAVGMHGSVTISGDTVIVTVRGSSRPHVLAAFGVGPFPVVETESARGIQVGGNR